MIDYIKANKFSLILVIVTFILGGIAIATALQLYRIKTTAPSDSSASAQHTINSCEVLTIPLSSPTPSASPSESPSPSPSATPTPSPSSTPTPTANPLVCDSSCNTDDDCRSIDSNYICYSATRTCRHINYPQENDCEAPPTSTASPTGTPTTTATPGSSGTAQATSTPTPATLPEAGISIPTLLGISAAGVLLLGALLLAL